MVIILAFTLAFGIPLQAIIRPEQSSFSFETLIDIFNNAYWPIYGEMKVLEDIVLQNCSDSNSTTGCLSETISKFSSYALLMIYIIIASVLLLNLLIAMFRHNF